MLAWLLSAALAQGSAHSCAVLARARARDELLTATLELRERAMALHLHIPHRFTLNSRRARLDVRASWSATITRVEQVRPSPTGMCVCRAACVCCGMPRYVHQLLAAHGCTSTSTQMLWPVVCPCRSGTGGPAAQRRTLTHKSRPWQACWRCSHSNSHTGCKMTDLAAACPCVQLADRPT